MLPLLQLWLCPPAQAATPMWRWLTVEQGLDPDTVTALAQGPQGQIWIGSSAGVQGWEGGRVTRKDDGQIRKVVLRLVALSDGRVVARTSAGEMWLIDSNGTTPMAGPSSEERVLDIADSGDGELVVLDRQGLFRWDGRTWTKLDDYARLRGSFRLREGRSGSMLLGGKEGWILWEDQAWVSLSPGPVYFPFDAVLTAEGNVWLLDEYDQVRKVSPTGQELMRLQAHGDARWMTMRGEELWWTSGDDLHRFAPNSPLGLQEMSFSIPGSGPLLTDAEGSLWAGTRRGLGQLAEPDALELSPREELGAIAGRSVDLNSESVWLGTWQNAVRFDRKTGTAHLIEDPHVVTTVCLDTDGIAWGFAESDGSSAGPVAMSSGSPTLVGSWPQEGASVWAGCAQASNGRVWTLSAGALWENDLDLGPQRLSDSPVPRGAVQALYIHNGSVWVGGMNRVCSTTEPLLAAGEPAWTCSELPTDDGMVADIVQTDKGNLWVSGVRLGVMRMVGEKFEPHPDSMKLPTERVMALRRSPKGGIWVLGDGVVLRVLDEPSTDAEWTVVENLSPRLGRALAAPEGLVEDADGTLWLAGAAGLVSIGQAARIEPHTIPSVRLSELRVDGSPVALDDVVMPRSDSRLGLRFTSPSYRAPKLLRYRLLLNGVSIGAPTESSNFEFAQLGPGTHTIEVAASLDGLRWSPEPTVLSVQVPRPWTSRWETWLALLTLLAAGLGIATVLRRRMVQRIERLRSDIAMDLHDEVGAGLASVGLLGGLLQEELPKELHADVSTRIVVTSKELGTALRSIVWSLQPSSLRIGALGAYLAERARATFAELDRQSALQVKVPPQQGPSLELDVLRAVQLIGLEALHNAARHSQATEVRLILEPAQRRSWRLCVEDNGVGIGPLVKTSVDSGHGLQSMARRARAVGADFEVESELGAGTRVTVTFQPKGTRT